MKKRNILLFLTLLLLPTLVYASDGNSSGIPFSVAILMEAFVTIHMTVFVLIPLANKLDPDKSKNLFKKLFIGRIIILLIFDAFITTNIAIIDFISVFVGAFILAPLSTNSKKTVSSISNPVINNSNVGLNTTPTNNVTKGNVILKCTKCGNILNVNDKLCQKCGTAFSGNNVQVVQDTSPIVELDQTYMQTEKDILRDLLIEELKSQGEDIKSFTTTSVNKKKNILLIFFGIATFLFTLMYYFNYPLYFCVFLEIVALIIYCLILKKFNVLDTLTKQAINNPDNDISEIVRTVISEKHTSTINFKYKAIIIILAIILIPSIYFFNPRVLYIRYSTGYSVLRYTRGITNDNNIVNIPEKYKGKQVLSISESAFKNSDVEFVNLPEGLESIKTKAFLNSNKLKEIEIPSTVKEIRGSAFEYCTSLTKVILHEGLEEIRASAFKDNVNLVNIDLPDSLEYLGASAFSHCSSLTEITIPKKVTEINGQTFEYCTSLETVNLHDDIISIHGEVFMGDISLVNITLPPKITEVRGNTFEGCSSLTSIVIPEGVTRIGGHAFYGCTSLSDVTIPSTINEIGSSAFRRCYSLQEIRIPYGTIINERAFKESPTTIYRY